MSSSRDHSHHTTAGILHHSKKINPHHRHGDTPHHGYTRKHKKHDPGIHDCHTIRDVLKCVTATSVLLLDLDNTVLRPKDIKDNGAEQWFIASLTAISKFVKDNKAALDLVLEVYDQIQANIGVKPVEPIIIDLVKRLRDCGIPIFFITSRGARDVMREATIRQLSEQLGIGCGDTTSEITITPRTPDSNLKPTIIGDIVLCDGENKGYCADQLLKLKAGEKGFKNIERVVLVDDSRRHHDALTNVLKDNYEVVCLHYQHLVERARNFDIKVAGERLLSSGMYALFSQRAKIVLGQYHTAFGISDEQATQHNLPRPSSIV